MEVHRHIERSLSTHSRQESVGLFFLNDFLDPLRGDRFNVCLIRYIRISHDRSRIRVHQNDPVSLFLQSTHGLRTGIVELTGLADHNRSRTQDENRV